VKPSKKIKGRLERRQAGYDQMLREASPHEQDALRAAYHRPGSLKKT